MAIFNMGGGGGRTYYLQIYPYTWDSQQPDLSGILVTATESGGGRIQGVTGPDGGCVLTVTKGRTYTVTLEREGYVFDPYTVVAATAVTNLYPEFHIQHVLAVQCSGSGVSGRTVTAAGEGGSRTATTGPDGTATLYLDPGTYTVTCDHPVGQGVSPESVSVAAEYGGSGTASFEILALPLVSLTVQSATGNAADRTIYARVGTQPFQAVAVTGVGGTASFNLHAGEYTVWCDSPEGYFPVEAAAVSCVAGETCPVTLVLRRKPLLSVAVEDASSAGLQSGRTVRIVGGSDVQTAVTDSSGACSFVCAAAGSYTVSVLDVPEGGTCTPRTVTAEADGEYPVSLTISFDVTYSVLFDSTVFKTDPYGCLTYADDAAGFSPVKTSGTSLVSSDPGSWGFDDSTGMGPFGMFYATMDDEGYLHQLLKPSDLGQCIAVYVRDTKQWDYSQTGASSITTENTLLCVPTLYTKGEGTKLTISTGPSKGTAYAHTIDGHTYEYLGYGVYLGSMSGDKLKSLSGKTAAAFKTRAVFRTAVQLNTVHNGHPLLWNWWQWRLKCFLDYVMAKDFNLQAAVGNGGRAYDSPTTGGTDAMGPYAGGVSALNTDAKMLIENGWGCLNQFVDDAYVSGTGFYVGQNSNPSDSTAGKTGVALLNRTGYGFPDVIRTDDDNWGMGYSDYGSKTTGLCDYQYLSGTSAVPHVGGFSGYVSSGSAGPGFLYRDSVTYSSANIGARPAFVFDL